MNESKDGGNAFPIPLAASPDGCVYHSAEVIRGGGGMSLRDYFAAAALQGMTSSMEYMATASDLAKARNTNVPALLAASAYEDADAMLAERNK